HGFIVDQLAVDGHRLRIGNPIHEVQCVTHAETHAHDIGSQDFHWLAPSRPRCRVGRVFEAHRWRAVGLEDSTHPTNLRVAAVQERNRSVAPALTTLCRSMCFAKQSIEPKKEPYLRPAVRLANTPG